jgi:hypothetical protein
MRSPHGGTRPISSILSQLALSQLDFAKPSGKLEPFSLIRRTTPLPKKPSARAKGKKPRSDVPAGKAAKLKSKEFESQLAKLEAELVNLQLWVKHKRLKVVVIFEGRDAAGKGGVIKRITERVSPRVFRVVALPAPTEREKSQMYIQRYISQLPAAGEVVIFDRSWYNRAGVERVMGFCTEQEVARFFELCPEWERAVVDSGIVLIKYWFEVEQGRAISPISGTNHGWPQNMEAEPDGPRVASALVRLFPSEGRYAGGYRHLFCAMVYRQCR